MVKRDEFYKILQKYRKMYIIGIVFSPNSSSHIAPKYHAKRPSPYVRSADSFPHCPAPSSPSTVSQISTIFSVHRDFSSEFSRIPLYAPAPTAAIAPRFSPCSRRISAASPRFAPDSCFGKCFLLRQKYLAGRKIGAVGIVALFHGFWRPGSGLVCWRKFWLRIFRCRGKRI